VVSCLSSPMSVGLDSFDSYQSTPIDPSDVPVCCCRGENDALLVVNVDVGAMMCCAFLYFIVQF
jgi:hypothetical protein